MTGSWSTSAEGIRVPAPAIARGAVEPPPSKSLTQRAFAVALLARERVEIDRPLVAEDTDRFLAVLVALGFRVERRGGRVVVEPDGPPPAAATADCGAGGTLLRLLTALATTLPGTTRIDGVPRLRERPVGALVTALRSLGAAIEYLGREGHAPLEVSGGGLAGGRVRLDARQSSQYLSALLLAAQRASGPVEIETRGLVSAPYVELTIEVLRRFGGFVERLGTDLWRVEPRTLRGGAIAIEPDLSAAAYPAAAAAITLGDVLLERVSLATRQGDRRLLALLGQMGARVAESERGVRVAGGRLEALDIDAADIPDQVPTLAAIAPFARGTTRIANVAHLRLKESDRLAAMASELRRVGAEVEELVDGLVVPGVWAESPPPSDPVVVDPHGDHRIAMAMTLVGLRRPGTTIGTPAVVAKSWPGFWESMARLAPGAGTS